MDEEITKGKKVISYEYEYDLNGDLKTMTREKQNKYKILNKEMSDIINKYSKQYKLKKKADFLWTSQKDFFFCIDFHLGITYEKAYLYAKNMTDVYFVNKGKKLSEYAMDYCLLQMSNLPK